MNDDDVSARDEAASAYLDGELDTSERASVTADSETMTRVEAFTRLRQTLGNAEPVADEVRDTAITAALAAFDVRQQIVDSRPPVHAAKVTMLHTRWRGAYRVLGGVAAAALVAVGAVAALNATKGTDSKSSSSATTPANAAEAPRTEIAADSSPAGGGAPAATSSAAGTTPPAAITKLAPADLPAVNSEADLAQYASGFAADAAATAAPSGSALSTATEMVPMPASPPGTCLQANDSVIGAISVLGVPAWAIRDTSTGTVRAIAAGDCRVLLTATP